MTEQRFHITGLDPRSTLCGRSGDIWAAPHWPDVADMRRGRFTRCKDCDRLLTPTLRAALDDARDLERAALDAYRAGWRNGCGLPAGPGEPGRTTADELVRECRGIGLRVGARAARLVHEAQGADPGSPTLGEPTSRPSSA